MSNVSKFPINQTRPSDDMKQSMKFEINAVMASEEFRLWLDDEISDYELLTIIFEMLLGDAIPPSYDEYMQDHAAIQKAIKEFKLLQAEYAKRYP